MSEKPVIVIAGPTASGKSALALAIAKEFKGAVINADSLQVYSELSILTARPDSAALAQAPHLLYGEFSLFDPCSAGRWREKAASYIEDTQLPIICGGTGLYIKALRNGLSEMPIVPPEIRQAAMELLDKLGGEAFRAELAKRDPESAGRLRSSDRQRLVRAWEVVEASGRPLSAWQNDKPPPYPARFATILLSPPRNILTSACDGRFLSMIEAGALEEAKAIRALSPDPLLPAIKALGLRELIRHLDGEIDLKAAISLAQTATRQYAKRQMTWFRHQLQPDLVIDEQFSERILPKIFSFIRQFLLTPGH
jgi:tRNA dimethylallyltransferase